ncbi:MAG: molybdopterin-dependent oxidoreductase, partial [Gammaproteobacteria bacterium]|nr:molybdopterin-dependent oxidoreductase [Gammaproteobacteria bacterium]
MSELIKTNCPRDCYDGCGIVVEQRNDGPHRVLGDPDHPVSRGKLCSKCAVAYNGVWQDPSKRLTRPLRRTGPRGSDQFEVISWDEALGEVAARMRETIDDSGAASILHTHYSGTLSLLAFLFPNRLFGHLGASEVDPDTICNAAGHAAWQLLYGSSYMGFDPRTVKDTSTILVWGANPSHSAPHTHEHWLGEAAGKVIVVDPYRTETAAAADLHLQPRPGTDAALAFALLHCLERDGAFDHDFIAAHATGFAEIEADIGRATPAWGESHTGVPAADIEQAARLYGAGPALLWCGQALQRQRTGGNIMRAVGLLPALTGNIGKPGAGFYYLNLTPAFAGIDLDWLAGADIASEGGKSVGHMELAERLEDPDEFKVFFAWNTNPLASAPEQQRLR